MNAVRGLKTHLSVMSQSMTDSKTKLLEQTDKALFGERFKLYDQMDSLSMENIHAFWGEKYKDPETRTAPPNGFSLPRMGGISVTVFALCNEGKYSFEDIMDPSKLHEEKQAMFDKVATMMKANTPESQKWLAKTIYDGQKNTEKMMDEVAKKVDFSKADITKDKTYCQMLHMSHFQFDAWQEMKHCDKEIVEMPPGSPILFADANVKALCVANWD